MQRKFAVTSVIKIYSKMWGLCMHPDHDHFIPLTSKYGKFQLQNNIIPGNYNPFSIKPYCCMGWDFWKKKHQFFLVWGLVTLG